MESNGEVWGRNRAPTRFPPSGKQAVQLTTGGAVEYLAIVVAIAANMQD